MVAQRGQTLGQNPAYRPSDILPLCGGGECASRRRVRSDRNAPWPSNSWARSSWALAKSLGTVQSRTSLALKPPRNCSCANCEVRGGVRRRAIGAPLDAPSCAHKLEHGLCQGTACGKGCLSRKSYTQDRSYRGGAFLSDRTLPLMAGF